MEASLGQYNALELAYLGDVVYELNVREYLLRRGSRPMTDHNRLAFALVNAAAQARAAAMIDAHLSAEERDIIRYGRNAKGGSARSASLGEYRIATGLECLLGSLYLRGSHERIRELMDLIIEGLMKEEAWKTF